MTMAINFSSFAACLAGLKVPRQIMYCIAQDPNTPYVFYNDGCLDRTDPWPQTGQTDLVYVPQQVPQNVSEEGNLSPPTLQHTSTMTSPVPSPYVPDEEVADFGEQQQVQTDYSRTGAMLTPTTFMHYLKQPGNNSMMLMAEPVTDCDQKPFKCDIRLFKCITCGKDFKQKSTLLQHERIHTNARPYACADCGKRFRQQSHLTQHLRIHANEKPFRCSFCERSFRQRAILNQHLRIHSGERPYVCSVCGRVFRQKAILNQHFRTHQDIGPQLLFKNGTTPTLWRQNLVCSENPPNPQQPVSDSTPPCYKNSKNPAHPAFSTTKLPGMPVFVKCPICQKDFKQKSTLLQHGCVHIESRPYPCGDCGKRFRQQSHLTQHLRIHTNEKPYACIYCGRHFRQRTILNQHLRIHTGEKPYRCLQCGKDFRQKAILDQHTRTHQGERPFCCPLPNCRRRFSVESEVKKHLDHHVNPLMKRNQTAAPHAVTYIKPELYFHANFSQFTADFKPPVITAQ